MKKKTEAPRKLPEERFIPKEVIPLKESLEAEPQHYNNQQRCIEAP